MSALTAVRDVGSLIPNLGIQFTVHSVPVNTSIL